MTKNRIALLVLALVAAAGLVFMFIPTVPIVTDTEDPGLRAPPDPAERIEVSNPLLVLPAQAGAPAYVQMDLRNASDGPIVITDVAVRHSDDTRMYNLQTPARTPMTSLNLDQGESISFGLDTDRAVLAEYDSSVVPGAMVELVLVLGDGEELSVPMRVDSLVGQGGEVELPTSQSPDGER